MKKIIQITGGKGEVFALCDTGEIFYMQVERRAWELLPNIDQQSVVGGLKRKEPEKPSPIPSYYPDGIF